MTYPAVNLDLARRLERTEAAANAASVESRCALEPSLGAEWIEVAGVYAMFDGTSSPLTQTFGLGLFESFGESEFEMIEQFFTARGTPTYHEVSSFVAPHTLDLLSSRGYVPIEASTVSVRPIATLPAQASTAFSVRVLPADELPLWVRISVEGWGTESPELAHSLENLGNVIGRAKGMYCFLAELDGKPVATAGLVIANDTALLAGATTIPSARQRGAQQALLESRLGFAATLGIDLAMIVTQPGSASQRNAIRRGFRPVYSRSKWERILAG